MPYYSLNRCKDGCLPALESLAESLHLERSFNESDSIQWEGKRNNYKGLRHSRGIMHLIYHPNNPLGPIYMQTVSWRDYSSWHIKRALRKIMETTGSTEVKDGAGQIVMER
jgi:hypothetical protein